MTGISHNSWVSVGLALTLGGVVFSAGMLKARVDANIQALSDFKVETHENFMSVNSKLDKLMDLRVATGSAVDSSY